MTYTFIFHSDSGHGWLQVHLSHLDRYKFQPSQYSYFRDGFAYLEEDCDMPAFMSRLAALGHSTTIIEASPLDGSSPIRTFPRFAS